MKRTFTIKKIDKEVKNSSFLLTINTNIADPRIKEPLRRATNWMFENLNQFLTFRNARAEQGLNLIDNIIIESAIEQGNKLHRIHLHSLIKIEHRTNLQLNLPKLRKYFEDALDLPNLHINVQYIKDTTFSIRKYISKQL